jgi:hypothetical protein
LIIHIPQELEHHPQSWPTSPVSETSTVLSSFKTETKHSLSDSYFSAIDQVPVVVQEFKRSVVTAMNGLATLFLTKFNFVSLGFCLLDPGELYEKRKIIYMISACFKVVKGSAN